MCYFRRPGECEKRLVIVQGSAQKVFTTVGRTLIVIEDRSRLAYFPRLSTGGQFVNLSLVSNSSQKERLGMKPVGDKVMLVCNSTHNMLL